MAVSRRGSWFRSRRLQTAWLGLAAAIALPYLSRAEENNPVHTALSDTMISGYVETSEIWNVGRSTLESPVDQNALEPPPLGANDLSVSPVPEPSTTALGLIGALLVGWQLRKTHGRNPHHPHLGR
jgi:hypothetical protein